MKLNDNIEIYYGDCLDVMPTLDMKFDAIITDPPYGTTACKWDAVIPFAPMWEQIKQAIKTKGAILLFGSEPFSSALRMSNIENYKYDWMWEKSKPSNFLNCKKQPMRKTENISVFYNNQCLYKPQGLSIGKQNKNSGVENTYGKVKKNFVQKTTYTGYPHNILRFKNIFGKQAIHPTQKPIDLMEYLIRTYTNEDETILDFAMGSGTTGVACINTGRKFVGIEKEKKYFDIAKERLQSTLQQPQLLTETK